MTKIFLFILFTMGLAMWAMADGEIEVISKITPKNNAFTGIVDSTQALVNTSSFSRNLTSADSDVQHALNTIDQLSTSGSTCIASGSVFCIYTGNGAYFTFDGTNFCLWVNSTQQQCWSHAATAVALLLETGTNLLLEDGTKLLLEQ